MRNRRRHGAGSDSPALPPVTHRHHFARRFQGRLTFLFAQQLFEAENFGYVDGGQAGKVLELAEKRGFARLYRSAAVFGDRVAVSAADRVAVRSCAPIFASKLWPEKESFLIHSKKFTST